MRLVSEPTLELFRWSSHCQYCGGRLSLKSEAAHVFPKGNGRVDVKENLIALGSVWDCGCHALSHTCCKPSRQQLIEAVASREIIHPDCIQEIVWAVRRLPKETSIEEALRVVALLRRPA